MATSHVVRPGEYLTSIAQQYSHRRWQTIYYHPDNAEFRRRRPNPNVILPGDRIVIPDRDQREEPCATDRRHRFVLERPVVQLRIVVRDDRARPLGNEPYRLEVGSERLSGITSSRGLLEHRIPVGVHEGLLRLPRKDVAVPLAIGHLDPIDAAETSVTGVQGRLNNLGFFCGRVDDVLGPRTTAAIRRFQQHVLGRPEADGALDAATREALVREHGS